MATFASRNDRGCSHVRAATRPTTAPRRVLASRRLRARAPQARCHDTMDESFAYNAAMAPAALRVPARVRADERFEFLLPAFYLIQLHGPLRSNERPIA
jgi:hypothetical protein